ncbi:hypothetical protein MWU65_07990 [Cellulophaga sp. F20128]|uniref:hypothetical protein n=1 Tax=Cellulophaga sp. F20128 TaxID=2926413 RepID=UPI001FF3F0B4|nr:hypothetical protein [Cellulophaga sp. F20128]MCK0157113.1 hypothetical protein [Cellulophaga sp. F20128]
MTKFLELTYYNNRDFIFPKHIEPIIDTNLVGIQTHYIDLSDSNYGENLFREFHNIDDLDLILELIKEYGVFFEKFLSAKFRHRIHPFFNNEENSEYLIEKCRFYYKIKESRNSIIGRIKHDFLKVSLTRLKNNFIYQELKKSELEKSEIRTCAICNNQFQPIKLPDWVYYGSNGNDTICFQCPISKNQKKQELKKLIHKLVKTCNFIPNSDFNPININFSSRINKEKWNEVCKIIFQMGVQGNDTLHSSSVFKKKFGSWFKALAESNVLPNGILESSRGFRCIARSGNECNSLDEMFVDNWLFENNIIAEKEPIYPKHVIYNKSGRRRADWKVGKYFIEYFGLKGEEAYDKKTKEKFLLAKELDLELIAIFPSDLNSIHKKLNVLLK